MKLEPLDFILKIKDVEPKNVDIWLVKLLSPPENTVIDLLLVDYKLIFLEVKFILLLELTLLELN
jgi:hypothetical protein